MVAKAEATTDQSHFQCRVTVTDTEHKGEALFDEVIFGTGSREEAMNIATQVRDYAVGTLTKGGVKGGSGQGVGA